MPNVRAIKTRIDAIAKIKKIANAIQVVALTRLRQVEQRTVNAKAYFDIIRELVFDMAKNLIYEAHPLLKPRKQIKRMAVIMITSDKGLCGGFNANIFKNFKEFISDKPSGDIDVYCVGKKGTGFLKRKGIKAHKEYSSSIKNNDYINTAAEIINEVSLKFLGKEADEVYILYNRFKMHVLGTANMLKILPVRTEDFSIKRVRDYIYEPTPYIALERILKEYMINQLAQAILESSASEEMARMMAMKQACDNADKTIEKLNLKYHKARQAQITRELVEIAAASEVS
jgi:F-type H+-transporting ATPase subunit gamma